MKFSFTSFTQQISTYESHPTNDK